MRKKTICATVSMLLLVSMFTTSLVSAQAAQPEPRYTGIYGLTSSLTMSSNGGAKCEGTAAVRGGYTVNLTVELKQDGVPIKEWTASGSEDVSAGGTYYVMSGHDYVVTTTAEVCKGTTNIETPSKDSLTKSY